MDELLNRFEQRGGRWDKQKTRAGQREKPGPKSTAPGSTPGQTQKYLFSGRFQAGLVLPLLLLAGPAGLAVYLVVARVFITTPDQASGALRKTAKTG